MRYQWQNFTDFVQSFRSRFGDPEFQFELRQEIHHRTQGERERVGDFITCMISLFDRVVPRLSEEEEISFVHRNVLPRFELIITRQNIFSLTQFEKIAVSVEKSLLLSKTYRPPSSPERSLLPDLAYGEPFHFKTRNNKELISFLNEQDVSKEHGELIETLLALKESKSIPQNSPINAKNVKPKIDSKIFNNKYAEPRNSSTNPFIPNFIESDSNIRTNVPKKISCWNCNKEGHRFDSCSEPKTIFCFKCGKKDVIRPTCPKCSEN